MASPFPPSLALSVRRELLDRTIIWNRQQLEGLIIGCLKHYIAREIYTDLRQLTP